MVSQYSTSLSSKLYVARKFMTKKKIYSVLGSLFVLFILLALSFPYLNSFNLQRNLEDARKNGITSTETNIRIHALNLLSRYGDKQDIPLFAHLLDDSDDFVRVPAADALSKFTGVILPIPDAMDGSKIILSSNPQSVSNIKTSILSDKKAVHEYIASWKTWWNSEGQAKYSNKL
jgi:hypothetical protein